MMFRRGCEIHDNRRKLSPEEQKEIKTLIKSLGSIQRTQFLQTLWRTSQPTPDFEEFPDKHTKFEVFRRIAVTRGFRKEDIDLFMNTNI